MAKKKRTEHRTVRERVMQIPAQAIAPLPVQPQAVMEPAPLPVEKQMRSIWYLVGLVLASMGGLIFLTGVYLALDPPATQVAMGHMQPDIWWGGVMVVAGCTFIMTHRNKRHTV